MKTEYREVTIQRPAYVSDDGKEFVDKEECLQYEFKLLTQSLKCYDRNYNKAEVDDCIFINLITDEDVKNFIFASDILGTVTDGIDGPGLYMFDDHDYGNGGWVSLDDIIFHIRGGVKNDQT